MLCAPGPAMPFTTALRTLGPSNPNWPLAIVKVIGPPLAISAAVKVWVKAGTNETQYNSNSNSSFISAPLVPKPTETKKPAASSIVLIYGPAATTGWSGANGASV